MAYTNIDDPSAYFQTAIYNGQSGTQFDVTNDGNSDLQPDLIWFKDRGAAYSHYLVDSSRGRAKGLKSDTTAAETTSGQTNWDLVSFDSDGFEVGAPSEGESTNAGTTSKAAWQWKANGGTTASNTDGSITSTVQANQDAGFSIVTYTAPSSTGNFTAGHGLGVKPDMVITKSRSATGGWWIWHKDLAQPNYYIGLHSTGAQAFASNMWGAGFDTSTIGLNVTASGQASATYIAYCFAEKQGYSKFGKYVGNGNASGPFVYTGFKPSFLLVKITTASGYSWRLVDSARNTFNLTDRLLMPDNTSAEFDGSTHASNLGFDFVSNGFKLRTTYYGMNGNTETFIYMAFAENPFVTSTGIPTTAR